MKKRLCALLLMTVLLAGTFLTSAFAESLANPQLANWTAPAVKYTTTSKGDALRGYQLGADKLGQVMKVTTKKNCWTRLIAPVSGEYSFSVDTDQLEIDSITISVYRAEGAERDLLRSDSLTFDKGNGIQTRIIRDVLAGETIYWTEGSIATTYFLMVSSNDWTSNKADANALPETVPVEQDAPTDYAAGDGLTGRPILTETPEVGDRFVMGWYEQDGYYDKRERIEWTVLEVNEQKDSVLVISSAALDCILYHPTRAAVAWGDSYIRSWLMNDFAYTALSTQERACIIPTKVAKVTDTVTMLDEKQIKKYKLAETGCDVTYYAQYAITPHVNVNENGYGCWWVRMDKTGSGAKNQFVGRGGKVYGGSNRGGNYTTTDDNGVRPAMYLSISALKQCPLGNDFAVVSGVAIDASNPGTHLGGVRVNINGEIYTTNNQGKFFFTMDPGTFHYQADRPEYIVAEGDITVNVGQNNVMIPLSRMMAENEYRVVLTWGENPRDLDSHLVGASSSGQSYHVFYNDLKADGGKALLEWDDTTSYGPETTHFFAYPNQSYVFSVHDYTNRGSNISDWMAHSDAKVVVYCHNQEVGTFYVPAGSATVWNVFRVDNNVVTPINTLDFCNAPRDVGAGLR